MSRTAITCTTIATLGLVAITALLALGPLNPPSGAITTTNKTLTEIEPRIAINATNTPGDNDTFPSLFKITAPGSYYLTGNITGVAGKYGIEIAASGVTLDLNGFDVIGVPNSLDGIVCTSVVGTSFQNVAVINGSVRNWNRYGVALGAVNTGRIQGIMASNNFDGGIVGGTNFTVLDCQASASSGTGIVAARFSTVDRCVSNGNLRYGIVCDSGGVIIGCSASQNIAGGFKANGQGSTIQGCTAVDNGTDGIDVGESCSVIGNTLRNNGLSGAGAGITAHNNCRIEGNHCVVGRIGIEVTGTGNVVIRNTCSKNDTNWAIGANNIYGPIIDRRIPTPVASTPAINGNSASSVLGSTDANANFTQ